MGGCRCSYRNCKSATKISENLHFFHYPVKHNERCKKWILNANKPNFFDLSEDQLRNKVVCELHFEDRCFSNSQKKRLLHDAVPTIDGDSQEEEMEVYQSHRSFENVQVLPANADGTIFMVDTDSLQQIPESKIESYILRDGSVVPLYRDDTHHEETQVMLTDTTINNYTNNFVSTVPDNYFPPEHELTVIYNDKKFIQSDGNLYNNQKTEPELQISDDSISFRSASQENHCNSISCEPKNNTIIKKRNSKTKKRKYVYRKIRQHSKDIAGIKKILYNNLVPKRVNKATVLNYLKTRIPSTLLDLININLNKSKNLDANEADFYKTINEKSPELYKMLCEKYDWTLPDLKE